MELVIIKRKAESGKCCLSMCRQQQMLILGKQNCAGYNLPHTFPGITSFAELTDSGIKKLCAGGLDKNTCVLRLSRNEDKRIWDFPYGVRRFTENLASDLQQVQGLDLQLIYYSNIT